LEGPVRPQAATSRQGKHRVLVLLAVVAVLASAGTAGYLVFRPRAAEIPTIPFDGLDAEVAANIEQARVDIKAKPRSADAWGHLGMVLFAQDMYAPCVEIFGEAERLNPRDARWPYFAGLALMFLEPEKGIVQLERAVRIAPKSFPLRLRLAEEYLKLQRIDEADALFRALFEENPHHARVLLGRGQILLRRGQWKETLVTLKAVADDPTARRSARVALAEAYARMGKAAEADAQRKRSEEVVGDLNWADPYLAEARALRTGLQPRIDEALDMMRKGQVQQAGELIGQVLSDHPDSDEAYLTLGRVLISSNQFNQAEAALRRAIELNPNLVDGHFLLGGIERLRNDWFAAEKRYLRAVELKPSNSEAQFFLGTCRLRLRNKVGAMTAFRDALRFQPDLGAAHLELGALLLEAGKSEEAIRHLDTAVRLDEKNERALGLLEKARARK
jgi:tetratricopeptide (TPR) repeat protein